MLDHGRIAAGLMVLIGGSTPLHAQTEQEIPTIEPTYTRIFGSDSIEIAGAQLSPDGRWVLFKGYHEAGGGIWIVSTEGGEPMRLTEGDLGGDGPVWFPTGDRIAFRSDGPGYWAVMTMPIDPLNGRPTGPARPVTLEGSTAYFDVSPDGRWIAYTPLENGQRVIRIVPSTGGTTRTLVAADTPRPLWSADGRHIYYQVAPGGRWATIRIAVEGGEPDTVLSKFARLGHSTLLVKTGSEFEVTTLAGEPRARFHLPGGLRTPRYGPDANNLLVTVMSDFGSALQILPVDGGPGRQLTRGQEEDSPIAWTDSDEILFSTQLNGNEVLLLAPAAGGAMRQVSLPEKRRRLPSTRVPPPFLSRDGSHLFYEVEADNPEFSVLKVLTVADGTIEEITSAHPAEGPGVTGPGGVPHFHGSEFLYFERHADRHELLAWSPERGSRSLWTFRGDRARGPVSVNEDRMIFSEVSAGRRSLRTARFGDAGSRELLNVSGWLQSAAWSPNGEYVAMVHVDTTGGWESARVAIQRVAPTGEPLGDVRYVSEQSFSWWNLRWLPDGSGVLAAGYDDGNVGFFPVDPSESPVSVTQDESNEVWEFVLSPDGRHIVYPRRISRGSSLWLVDLGEIPEPSG